MKYFKVSKLYDKRKREEISYEEALYLCLGVYKDNDMTRDMLSIPNRIELPYSVVECKGEDGLVLMPGLANMLPLNAEYDDDGNRIN